MNFTQMVSNFKRRVLEEGKEELEELSGAAREKVKRYIKAVSYTHLTLPTNPYV